MKSFIPLSLITLALATTASAKEFAFQLRGLTPNADGNFVSSVIVKDRENSIAYEIVPANELVIRGIATSETACIYVTDGSVLSRTIDRDDEARRVTETVKILARKVSTCR